MGARIPTRGIMPSLSERPLRYAQPLSEEASSNVRLRRQWAVLTVDSGTAPDWERIPLLSGHVLVHHPDARIAKIDGERSGVVVFGPMVTTDRQSPLEEQLQLLTLGDDVNFVATLRRLAGTYVVIRHCHSQVRIYTDPAGMMPVFFRGGRAASTPALLPPLVRDTALDRQFPFGRDNDWYPWTLTPFKKVYALPANHVLSLPECTIERFWPTERPLPLPTSEGVDRIAQLLRTIAVGSTELGPLLCSLTGGRDSRVNLAALGQQSHHVEFFTVRGDGVSACDVRIPELLARRWELNHRFVDNRTAPPWLVDLYDEMTCGMSVGGRRSVIGAAASLASPTYIHLNGNLGAVAKSFFWHKKNPHSVRTRALAKELTDRPPPIKGAIAQWMASVPDLDAPTTYNLMYFEQRGGRWMGVGETASNLFYDSISPFCSREVFETVCALPPAKQFGGDLLIELVQVLWPELLATEYCLSRRNLSGHVPRAIKNRVKKTIVRRGDFWSRA